MQHLPDKLKALLEKRSAGQTHRRLLSRGELVDFSSNDYLGLARSQEVHKRAGFIAANSGLSINGATGSRLLSGNHRLFEEAETMLARHHCAQAALIFNSGYDANLGLLSALLQRGDIVLYDELVHASIRDGLLLSRAKKYKFRHNDLASLSNLLDRYNGKGEVYVITESVFSMDGDSPDLVQLVEVCKKNDARLIVDEAHAIGLSKSGLIPELGLESDVFARVITFGKAIGCHGAAVLGLSQLIDYLINFARSLIYTTALAPHSIACIIAAYELLWSQEGEERMAALQENIRFFSQLIDKTPSKERFLCSRSAIQGYLGRGNNEVLKLANMLFTEGLDVRPIRYPTVPEGSERLRIVLHSFNTREQLRELVELLESYTG